MGESLLEVKTRIQTVESIRKITNAMKLIANSRYNQLKNLYDGNLAYMEEIKEAMELVKKAALEVPQVKYVGWDVFIGPNGPGIIEGNDYPGYDFWQLPEHTPDKIGLVPYYENLIKDLKL